MLMCDECETEASRGCRVYEVSDMTMTMEESDVNAVGMIMR